MFVQRLINWLRRIFTSVTARARVAQPSQTDDSAVMSGCASGQRAVTSGSWLDDGRSLRPRPTAQSTQEPRWTVRGIAPRQHPAEQPGQNRRPVPSRPVPAHPAAESASADASAPRPQTPQPEPSVPPARLTPASLDAHGARSDSNSDDSGIHDQALYRRLMSLKRLVRLGIYGEGFDTRNVPEQYLHSLGRDGDFDSLEDFDDFDDLDADWDEHQPSK